ncbi:hypothetical protein DUI87_20121 [Hirundo rustica rustica]|uniref:Uncharacterized protein n=1 Tax=Hirundo rustica rustica TaxID=333673 RepID=A0A3M0JPH8_HIRRU|nr:hypothetical protein DUI87_20121 [Hirundo rustica rustica]
MAVWLLSLATAVLPLLQRDIPDLVAQYIEWGKKRKKKDGHYKYIGSGLFNHLSLISAQCDSLAATGVCPNENMKPSHRQACSLEIWQQLLFCFFYTKVFTPLISEGWDDSMDQLDKKRLDVAWFS